MPKTPLKAEVALPGVTTVPPVPETTLQAPVPIAGTVAAMDVDVLQSVWSTPAFAADAKLVNVISTLSVLAVQGAFAIVQRNVYVVPCTPVNPLFGLLGAVMEPPAPEMMLQEPEPTPGVLEERLALVAHSV